MTGKIQKWGNSLAVRLPKAFADSANMAAGSEVDITIKDDKIEIRPVRKRKYVLADLVAKVTPKNRHEETDWGSPVGREIW